MGFLEVVTPAEMTAGHALGLATMVVLIFVGHIPPLRPYATRIRRVAAGCYLAGVAGFVLYFAMFR
ncbi:MAG: hypothetical protein WCI94_00260 [Rhodospirillales bacterium]